MYRPILFFLICLSAGILLGFYVPHAVPLALVFGLAVSVGLYKRLKYSPIFLCALAALAGTVLVHNSQNERVQPAQNVQISGVVHDIAATRVGWQRLAVDSNIEGTALRLMVFLSPRYAVEIGDRAIFTGDIALLRRAEYQGGYDEFMHRRTAGITARMNARHAEVYGRELTLRRLTFLARERLVAVYNAVLPTEQAALMQSIMLGDNSGLDDYVRERYRDAGIYHLLVVSGGHLSLLMLAITLALEKFLNRRAAGIIALAVMIFYTLMVGAGTSIVRAVLMAGVLVAGRLLYRDTDALASVSFAAIVLLLVQPLFLFDIGFQLSFGAVFGLIILPGATERFFGKILMPPGKSRAFLSYNIAAALAVSPITAYHFGRISTYGILVNLVILPTATVMVVMGTLVALIGLASLEVAAFLAGTLFYMLRLYDFVIDFFLALPNAVWNVPARQMLGTLAVFGLMGVFVYVMHDFK